MLTLVDNAVGGFPLLFVGFFELILLCYVYGWYFMIYEGEYLT
jgi:hypothetical protein